MKWEYRIVRVDLDHLESELNEVGEHGWELVTLVPDREYRWDRHPRPLSPQAIFKRPKSN
jgi:hypothetical protein